MNLKRHHVLYALLAFCLITGVLVLLTPGVQNVSDRNPVSTASSAQATSSQILPLKFEVVTSTVDQEKGLSGRSSIPENYAMLFVFPAEVNVGFWMKDMLVPIDIIWLSDTGTILGIDENVSPDTYPKAFYPPKPVKYVLETKVGEARRRGWTAGTKVELPAPYPLPSSR